MGITVMAPIGNILKNTYADISLGWTHEGKTQFIIITHGCPLVLVHRQGKKCTIQSGHVFLSMDT